MREDLTKLLGSLQAERDKIINELYSLRGEDMAKSVGRLTLAGDMIIAIEKVLSNKAKPIGFITGTEEVSE